MMLATYKWRPEYQLVEVHLEQELEFKQDLSDAFFPGRRVVVLDGIWKEVMCDPQEWHNYLTFVFGSLSMQVYLQDVADKVFQEIRIFRMWRALVESEVGFNPNLRQAM